MSFDGVFIHHLVDELKHNIINERINKIYAMDKSTFILSLSNKRILLISINQDSSHLRFIKMDFVPAQITFPLYTLLKKYLEGAIIRGINQVTNDRIIEFDLDSFDDFGFSSKKKLVLELFGRNSNLLILNENDIIIDASRKSFELGNSENRIIHPKVKYRYPDTKDKINPFDTNKVLLDNSYLGVSKLLFNEITFQNNLDIIKQSSRPALIKVGQKYYFYAFELFHLNGEFTYFDSLSTLLEEYFLNIREIASINSEQKQIDVYLRREIEKIKKKLQKQFGELDDANKNLSLEQRGNLLSANLYRVKRNMKEIIVEDFYNDNKEVIIPLNPIISPASNLEVIYNKFKKAKRSIIHLETQILATKDEITYLNTLLDQLDQATHHEVKEILEELNLSKKKAKVKKKQKPHISNFKTKDSIIMVGKNNIQNNYLTHTLANKNDYFFHVKGVPGSHTILRCSDLREDLIILAANIAASFSKSKNSENVAVDYCLVRYVKKVNKTKGSFVTYSNHKTIYVTPSLDFIKNNTI